jgi:sulfur carrier protein ThiS
MKLFFINNDGGGFADTIEVPESTTISKLFQERMSHGKPADYLIRVNRQPVSEGHLLQEGDRVTVTPIKIEGAQKAH